MRLAPRLDFETWAARQCHPQRSVSTLSLAIPATTAGCPILYATLFRAPGWDTTNLSGDPLFLNAVF
ncbi:MAG TPA: hypothetical protein VGF88_19385 [Acidobacteriaceae bacterium]